MIIAGPNGAGKSTISGRSFNASARIGTLQPILNIAFHKIKFVTPLIPDWAQSIIDSLKANYPSKDRNPGDDTPPTGVSR
ncbi:hypothetical protein [Mucilaginibacter phyllosphaerae]